MDSTTVNLEKSTTGQDLYQSHKNVIAYWSPFWDQMEIYYDNLAGEMWTPDEKLLFKRKKKAPVVINDLKPAERTILGLFIQNKYDVKFAPREDAQDISDVLQKLYAWTAYTQDWAFKDIELVRAAWCGGVGYQEVYVKVVPGNEPVILTNTLNPFSIAWDPESRDLINREDAQFVDRDTWVSFDDLIEMFPDKVQGTDEIDNQGSQTFQNAKTYADRTLESFDVKNNRYKVTERLYKVRKVSHHATDGKAKIQINPQDRQKYQSEGFNTHSESIEMLHLAIICPAWNNSEYLYNGEYYCQPRDLFTQKIIWPILELVAESINGVPGGFVQHLIQINRLKNSAVSNLFHAQKHAASTALIRKRKLFGANEAQASSFDANHSDADRVFEASDSADLGTDIIAVPKGIVSQDTDKTLDIASNAQQSISSTPPALQGQAESSSTSGILNSQRIEQSFVQLQVLIANVKHFLKRRAELVYYYWREYFTYPMKIRIVGGQSTQQANQPQPQNAQAQQGLPPQQNQGQTQPQQQGQQPPQQPPTHIGVNQDQVNPQTGALERINDINSARYDVDIEDSYQSPTYRAKRMQELSEIMQKAGNIDPHLMQALFVEYANSTDMSQATKDIINQYAKQQQDQASQPAGPPPQKPPNVSFAFNGQDFSNAWVQEITKQTGVLSPDAVQRLEQTPPPPQPIDGSQPAQPTPIEAQRHIADMQLTKAKTEGQHLDNAQKMQKVADNEAQVNGGLVPSVAKSFSSRPTAFAPMGAR